MTAPNHRIPKAPPSPPKRSQMRRAQLSAPPHRPPSRGDILKLGNLGDGKSSLAMPGMCHMDDHHMVVEDGGTKFTGPQELVNSFQ